MTIKQINEPFNESIAEVSKREDEAANLRGEYLSTIILLDGNGTGGYLLVFKTAAEFTESEKAAG